MKTQLTAVAFILFAALPFALSAQNSSTRTLPAFDRLGISGGFDKVILKEGDAEAVVIEASGVSTDDVITEVKGSTLSIRMKKWSSSGHHIKITLTYRNLKEVSNSGSTDVEAISTIKGDAFELNSSGSGDFTGALDVRKLEIAISGSADMKLSGSADKQEIAISGSGDVDAGSLSGKEAEVAISGSGDIKLHVDGPVRTAVSGSGKVVNN